MSTSQIVARLDEFHSNLQTKFREYDDRFFALEQHSTRPGGGWGSGERSLGSRITDSEQFKSMTSSGARNSGRIAIGSFHDAKTAIVSATGLGQPLVSPQFVPGISIAVQQRLTIRDLLPAVPTSSNMISFTRESSFTNNAEVQGYGSSPQVYENVAKAESAAAFDLQYQPVMTIGHWLPVSRQIFDDSASLRGYIDARLTYGLKLKEEQQLLTGSGVGAQIKGLTAAGNYTAYDTSRTKAGDTYIDVLRHGIAQVRLANVDVEAIVLHPDDWEAIELVKTQGTASSGQYIVADPKTLNDKRLWGKVVIDTISMPRGHFLVGAFSQAATIWDRSDATIEISLEHSDFFVKNMAAILCEERLALTVMRADMLVYGSFS